MGGKRTRGSLPAVLAGATVALVLLAACEGDGTSLIAGAAPAPAGSELVGITDAGQTIGNAAAGDPPGAAGKPTRAFVVDAATGARRDLDLAGGVISEAADVATNGFVVGSVTMADGASKAVAWDVPAGRWRELARGPYRKAAAVATNRHRTVVGRGSTGQADVAVLWRTDGALETVAPLTRFTTASKAADINESDVVVGELTGDGCCARTGFVWSRTQGLRRLPVPGVSESPGSGGAEASATGINDKGDIVGWVSDAKGRHAARWRADSLQVELVPDLGAGGELAAVNDEGIALGYARHTATGARVPYCVNLRTRRTAVIGGASSSITSVSDDGRVMGTDNGQGASWSTAACT